MPSFTVPYTDDQIDVDVDRRVVRYYQDAWNRNSSGTPDRTYTFDALLADRKLLLRLTCLMAGNDATELEKIIGA